jgi:hypothetical protein
MPPLQGLRPFAHGSRRSKCRRIALIQDFQHENHACLELLELRADTRLGDVQNLTSPPQAAFLCDRPEVQ